MLLSPFVSRSAVDNRGSVGMARAPRPTAVEAVPETVQVWRSFKLAGMLGCLLASLIVLLAQV